MSNECGRGASIKEHSQLAKLIAAGAVTATVYRGYVGSSKAEGCISLYPSLDDLSKSIEISRSDIVDFEEFSESGEPSGKMSVWVRKDAQIAFRQVATVGGAASAQVNNGRLKIQIGDSLGDGPVENCHSNCNEGNCHSNCRFV